MMTQVLCVDALLLLPLPPSHIITRVPLLTLQGGLWKLLEFLHNRLPGVCDCHQQREARVTGDSLPLSTSVLFSNVFSMT